MNKIKYSQSHSIFRNSKSNDKYSGLGKKNLDIYSCQPAKNEKRKAEDTDIQKMSSEEAGVSKEF